MKLQRQAIMIDIITKEEIKTQEQLSERLRDLGYTATQATISRDIKELRLVKVASLSGGYKYATGDANNDSTHLPRLKNIFKECVVRADRAQNLVVVRTLVGMANAAAAAIDAMKINDIIGTLAGDDTILVILRNNEDAERLCQLIEQLLA